MGTFIARSDYPVIDLREECRSSVDQFTGNPVCPIRRPVPVFRSALLSFVTGSVNRGAEESISA